MRSSFIAMYGSEGKLPNRLPVDSSWCLLVRKWWHCRDYFS